MKLSQETLRFLEVFSGVNNNLTVRPGKTLRTASPGGNIYIEANVVENFPVEFGIYDLRKLLGVIKMLPKDFEVEFHESHLEMYGANGLKFIYYYSSTKLLTQVPNEINMPECQYEFTLPSATWHTLTKSAQALQVEDLIFEVDSSGFTTATVTDKAESTSHSSRVAIPAVSLCNGVCRAILKMKHIRLMDDDYVVRISNAGVVSFVNKAGNLHYYTMCEADSTWE